MSKIILCRGIQGSGKTTWAKQWVIEDPEHRVRFNNDDIRNMLGKYWVPNREHIVKVIKDEFLRESMVNNYDIVIDNMNLSDKELWHYNDIIDEYNRYHKPAYEIEFKDFFDTSLQDCIERDSKRPNPIGEEVIRKTYEKYKHIIEK